MTKKMAVFVEGQTEMTFVRRLLDEMAGQENVRVIEEKKDRGRYLISEPVPSDNKKYELLVVNCGNDEQVASSIIERYEGLVSADYALIVGLRDLFPMPLTDHDRLTSGINSILPVGPTPCHVVVAKSEVEAWFVQEQNHFPVVDDILTKDFILESIDYDIDTSLAETLHKPSSKLDEIYNLAGRRYRKKKYEVSNIVYSLDMANLYLDRRSMLVSFDSFVTLIEGFLR